MYGRVKREVAGSTRIMAFPPSQAKAPRFVAVQVSSLKSVLHMYFEVLLLFRVA